MAAYDTSVDKFWPGEALMHHVYHRDRLRLYVVTTETGIFVKTVHGYTQGPLTGEITEYLDCLDYENGVFKLRQRKCSHIVPITYVAWRDRQYPVGSKVLMKGSNAKPHICSAGS